VDRARLIAAFVPRVSQARLASFAHTRPQLVLIIDAAGGTSLAEIGDDTAEGSMARWLVLVLVLALSESGPVTAAEPRLPPGLPREYLAESIVNFERFIAHGQYKKGFVAADGTSRMGDYNDLLTVRDLLDLVEFLRSIR
jgi:hypothetical protein